MPDSEPAASPSETVLRSVIEMWRDFLEHLPLLAIGLATFVMTIFFAQPASWLVRRVLDGRN